MAIVLSDNIKTNAPKPTDSRYLNVLVPYSSTTQVNGCIAAGIRYTGLTVNVAGVEYWYCGGIDDNDLVIKSSGSASLSVWTITGNSSNTGFTIQHDCNQQFVMVQVAQAASPFATVYTNVQRPNANCVCVTFDDAPPSGTCYKILITG